MTGRSRPITSWVTGVCLIVLPVLAAGQSLGDAAKKEQARREKVQHAGGRAPAFTEEDLSSTPGRLANDPNELPVNSEAGAPAAETRPASAAGRSPLRPQAGPPETPEAYWRGRFRAASARVELARRQYDTLQRMIRFGQPARHDANGRVVIYSIHQLKAQADLAAAELAAAEKALESLLDEARRAGALPGWLR